jgi:hypothetical protein
MHLRTRPDQLDDQLAHLSQIEPVDGLSRAAATAIRAAYPVGVSCNRVAAAVTSAGLAGAG